MRKDRIEARLRALQISQFEAAKRAGKGSNFVYDLLNGRKREVKGQGPERLARALECSVEYLRGETDEVGYPPGVAAPVRESVQGDSGVEFAGTVETDVFRAARLMAAPVQAPFRIPHDPRFAPSDQRAFLLRGEGLSRLGVSDGMLVVTVSPDVYEGEQGLLKTGDVVVLKRTRNSGTEIELSAREVVKFNDRCEYRSLDARGGETITVSRDAESNIEVVGVVTMVCRVI